MALIEHEIQAQTFELILARICEILADELDNQLDITSDDLFSATVWQERFIALDKTELPAVNVFFNGVNYDSNNALASHGDLRYTIEVHTSGKHTSTERGDTFAALQCHKLIGVIRYILENPYYLRLGYATPQGFIRGTKVDSIDIAQPEMKDGIHSIVGILVFTVRAAVLNGTIEPVVAEGYTTKAEISETENGYKYELNN
jgi:hypothetical protein